MADPVGAASLFQHVPEPSAESIEWLQWIKADIAPKRAEALLVEFGSPTAALAAGESIWRRFECTEAEQKRMKSAAIVSDAEKEFLRDPNAGVAYRGSPAYAPLLAQVSPMQAAYFYRGVAEETGEACVGLVGTRRASPLGLAAAEYFGSGLARAGVTIVTGGGHGIEAMAVRAALDAGGRCVCCLPCGPDHCYPEDHWRLIRLVAERGAVLYPFPIGNRPLAGNFQKRNRFLAALCHAVVVIEAPRGSGSLGIPNFANEDGRQVFVTPGPFNAPSFEGNHDLMRLGATVVTSPIQILDDLGVKRDINPAKKPSSPISSHHKKLLDLLGTEALRLDEIARRLGRPALEVAADLTYLELAGFVSRASGGTYCLRKQ